MSDNGVTIRPLAEGDLEAVVAIGGAEGGAARRGFFEKRFAAMGADPEAFVSLGAEADGRLVGFLLARLLQGEFGGTERVGVLDAVSVEPGRRGRGVGAALLAALEEALRARGAVELRTQVEWNRPGLLDFFARHGFSLAPRLVLERGTAGHDF
ncbi:GNAT family N-acetyltransferase [Inmirania thermothiophila]|uniref:L-amino acid N-acyltransferase YncA n=1 Tax=Inmirania thermothiophila TaxID=1750597 RepID=A0A3N1Y0X5_9GAMM|nr:GNAT family N-acetyltransferase [Inmirania thermothiophila]ROR32476.1 L-amino acid N-acyltransferase YncA [Inmirania thermothiophila]